MGASPHFDILKATPQKVRAEAERRTVARCGAISLDPRTAIPDEANIQARAKLPDPFYGMNKTEARYARELESQRLGGRILQWFFEAVTFKIASDCRYTPDFMVIGNDGLVTFTEIKGRKGESFYAQEDAKIKVKVAARMFPFEFTIRWPSADGGWCERKP